MSKNPFRASQRTCRSWIFVTYFIIRAYRDVLKWKNAMKKLDFTPKNVINCVHNEPALWDTECTDDRRPSWSYYTYRLISLAFIFGSIVLYASYLRLSPIYCLTHVECFGFFMAANIDFVWSRFEASLQLACDLLSTCFRPACDTLTQVCNQVCSQVCSLLE